MDTVDTILADVRRIRSQRRTGLRSERKWFEVKAQGTSADIMLYDEIGWLGVEADQLVREIKDLNVDQINLDINSPGGDVFDAIAIHNALASHSAHVTATVNGLAASAASFIFQAADERVMADNSQLMIHDAWGMEVGPAAAMEKMRDILDRASNVTAGMYAKRSGRSVDEIREAMLAETWYGADEAVEAGLADSVSGKAQPKNTYDLRVFSYAGRDSAPAPQVNRKPNPEDIRLALKEAFK